VSRLHQWVWSVLLLAVGALVGIAIYAQSRRVPLPVLGQWQPFTLTNHLGEAVGPQTFQGQVVIANVIFSRCPTQCHQLSLQMSRLQSRVGEGVRLLSLTADPLYDSPEVLTQYGRRYGTDPARWWFLTGPKAEVYRVAEKDLLFTVLDTGEPNPKLEERFIHSGNYVVLDRQGRLRAVVQGEDPDAERRLARLAQQLSRETSL
jgi:protein SCO1/2